MQKKLQITSAMNIIFFSIFINSLVTFLTMLTYDFLLVTFASNASRLDKLGKKSEISWPFLWRAISSCKNNQYSLLQRLNRLKKYTFLKLRNAISMKIISHILFWRLKIKTMAMLWPMRDSHKFETKFRYKVKNRILS